MLYEESWINGHMYWRTGAGKPWVLFTIEQYRDKVQELRAELNWIREHSVPVDGVDFEQVPLNLKAPQTSQK